MSHHALEVKMGDREDVISDSEITLSSESEESLYLYECT